MTRNTILMLGSSALLSLGLLGGAATMASADQHATDAGEAQAFLAAPGSIGDAIAAVEAKSGGKTMGADYETNASGATVYEVAVVMPDGTVSEYTFNPTDSSVTMMDPSMDHDENDGNEAGEGAESN